MSESEVSQIRDEDVLRHMWQQTEDFSRKKEIRAHMYRLREERLRDLYSPEPAPAGKGCEFTSAQGHVKSFADQNFQSMKSKEVRDAGSPPKEFAYRGQDLKELSNAGWNVESEDHTTDDGRTHVKSVNANIEGRYDVEGGRGEFAAVDRQRQAVTEHRDDHSSMRRDETSSATAAHEHVQRQTDDGTRFSSTTSSSNTSSKIQQVSSTKHETVPYVTDDDYDLMRHTAHDTNRNEHVTRTTNRNDTEQTLRKNDFASAELVSRKIEYPDDNTKVIVETRCLPDGTRVTSTRREFRAPAQSTRSEYQTRSESQSYSSQHKSDTKDSKTTRQTFDNRSNDIVNSQRNVDDYDFKRQIREYTDKENDDYSNTQQRHVTKTDRKVTDLTDDDYSQKHYETRTNSKLVDRSTTNKDNHSQTQQRTFVRRNDNQIDEVDRHHITTIRDHDIQHKVVNESHDTEEKIYNITKEREDNEEKRQVIRGRTDTEDSIRYISKDRSVPIEKARDSAWDGTVPVPESDRDAYNPRHGTVPVERVREIPRNSSAPVGRVHHIPRDRTVPAERNRDIPRDRTVPVERVFDTPGDGTVPDESVRDIPRDATVPVEIPRDGPRDSTTPVDRIRDKPKDGTLPENRTRGIPRDMTVVDERVYTITKDTKVDEKVERNTSSEYYQTTYQNDYQTRKISTDWSPTHQAWASTLRSDTPSTTRPSTRASSPGSKTFKSSTSSLRSSVSPDKSFRKPSSRGGSPNKVDRCSPTRTVSSDRYSSTHSTQSVTELRTTKNSSPERKPPTGRSSGTPGYSPDRRPQDLHRQRPSASPEKKPKKFTERPSSSPESKPSLKSTPSDEHRRATSPLGKKDGPKFQTRPKQSPERKPIYQPSDENLSDTYSRTSPDSKPTDGYPNRSSPRSSPSPDRKPGYQKPTDLHTSGYPRTSSPSRPRYPTDDALPKSGTSPDRKPRNQQPSVQPEQSVAFDQCPQDSTKKKPSLSPDRKPSYMRPTAASHPEDKTRRPSKPGVDPNRKSPIKQMPAQTADHKPQNLSKNTVIKEDHSRFVDEETKVYTQTEKTNIDQKVTKSSPSDACWPRDKSPSPISKAPNVNSPDFRNAPFIKAKSPSPQRNSVTNTENDDLYGRIEKTVETTDITSKEDKQTEDITTVKRTPKNKEYPGDKDIPNRETSPAKYGTYDKKKTREVVNTSKVTTITAVEDTKDVKFDSLTPKDKISSKSVPDVPSSPKRKSPKDNTSPNKSPAKDTKYKHTTQFLTTERTTEEINKKITAKDHPRQLVTPSSSPTRRPNITETEPSTGQSSPTTSVSGFVYFGSPRSEKPMVTDLDEFYPDSENPDQPRVTKRPESLDVKRSPSPSKIPCRSPSPEKHVPTIKDNLPRKSSLKKPSTNINQASPIDKPPTSFCVSPTDDKPKVPEHKVVKKDQPGEPETGELETGEPDSTFKPKPPLQRRETYEDRCKKILGMADNTTTDSVTRETRRHTSKLDSSQSSPSVSPCDSPAPKESSPFPNYPGTKKTTNTKVDITEFITREQENHIKTTLACDDKQNKVPSRESSPTKLQDIKKTTLITDKTTKDNVEETTTTKTVKTKYPSPKQSRNQPFSQPSNQTEYNSYPHIKIDDSPKDAHQRCPSESPEGKPRSSPTKPSLPRDSSPTRLNLSPERKVVKKYQKESSPCKIGQENITGYKQTTTSETSKYDTMTTIGNIEETTNITKTITNKSQPMRISESPTRQIPKSITSLPDQSEHPRNTSPSRPHPKDGSPVRKIVSHDHPTESDRSRDSKIEDTRPDNVTRRRPSESPERTPNYMKSTTAITSKYDSTYTSEDKDETYTMRVREKKEPRNMTSSSPTRQTPQSAPKAGSPTKPSPPSDSTPKKLDLSPQRKPSKEAREKNSPDEKPKDSHTNRPHEIPGYMKSTTATTTKFDTTISDNVQETIKTKSVEKKLISVAKPTRPSDISPDRKPRRSQQPSSSVKESPTKNPETKHATVPSPTRPSTENVPGYMQTTASITSKYETTEYDSSVTDDIQEKISTTSERKYSASSKSKSPTRHTPKYNDESTPEYLRTTSPSRPSHPDYDTPKRPDSSPDRRPGFQQPTKDSPTGKPVDTHPKGLSPASSESTPGYIKTTKTAISNCDTISTTEDIEENIYRKNVHRKQLSDIPTQGSPNTSDRPRTLSPLKPTDKLPRTSALSSEQKPSSKSPIKESFLPESTNTKHTINKRLSVSPERPSYMKATASTTSKIDTVIATHATQENVVSNVVEQRSPSSRASVSPIRHSPEREPRENLDYLSKPDEQRQLRTPSPIKKITKVTEVNTDFMISEREQEILNKVQNSLRKLSPERKERSPSRERSPTKSTTSLLDLDIVTTETIKTHNNTNKDSSEIIEEQVTAKPKIISPRQPKEDKHNTTSNKPSSRNVSPTKRVPSISSVNKVDRSPESPTKSRSFSPKKPMSQTERPQSPQVSGIKPREQIPLHLTRKPTPATLSATKIERLTTDIKKINNVTKQNVYAKTSTSKTTNRSIPSPTSKTSEPDSKRTPILKSIKDNISPKKDAVTRTASDIAMKPKKTSSPQRMKSKPEIQVSDMSTKTTKSQKPLINEPHSKLPNKPKSATALNTSVDEDDIIIDVQQSKSSRENSPDRICPTPVNFSDDVGIPRFPDEVSEPDDELVKRTYHTIHETESVVDDIVEICEDEELFVKKSSMDVITEHDDSLLSVNDKVNKFTSGIRSVSKPKDTTTSFKDTERRVHSDFINDNLKSDECLLTVSEKVNKFAKGPRDTKDSRSPSRKITDEYDRDTVYQDDYTKLSVNDKAHLFVETSENVKVAKIRPAQKVDRPDLSHVDESLKSDDCLLSVSDKVSKFVKTAEKYVTETHEIEDTEKKITEQHDKIIRKIVDDDDEEIYDINQPICSQETIADEPITRPEHKSKSRSKEPQTSHQRLKDYGSPNTKPTERVPVVKITTLRSSEAVKKAKALFENIASTQKTTQKETTPTGKTTKLTDIGVIKKSPITDSTTVLHSSIEDVSLHVTDAESEVDVSNTKKRPSSGSLSKPQYSRMDEKPRSSPDRLIAQSPEVPRSKSPMRQSIEVTTAKTVMSRYPASTRAESPMHRPESPRQRTESPRQRSDSEKPDKVPGYLRPTKTSQIKEETKLVEETVVSSRRGSGKFGVELRMTSAERSTLSSERRRSIEHHQPCIEDIFDLDLLEQMLEKVTGYEQRRRIRAQIRIAKSQGEHEVDTNTYTRTTKQITVSKTRSPERRTTKSPEKTLKTTPQKTSSPDRHNKSTPQKTIPDRTQPKEVTMNGHAKEPRRTVTVTRQRPHSPEKPVPKSNLAPRTLIRQPSPDKRRTMSPSKTTPKPKGNRFNEYASAYMKKVGLNESDKVKFTDVKEKKTAESKHERQQATVQEFTTTRSFTERTSSKDVIEVVQTNEKRSSSPQQRQSPERKVQFPEHKTQVPERKAQSPERKAQSPVRKTESPERKAQSPVRKAQSPERKGQSPDRSAYSPERKAQSPERLHQRTPSPDFKRPKGDIVKETIIKTVHDIEKKVPSKPVHEEKPSWVTNRNLKKTTSETRTYSSKKIENEKPKYRTASPSKVISKPLDVITSSYGPGPLDADGKPLFGIKALRNGASNFQVKGTVIRQEFHSRNGGEPEGTVSVTAYSSQPEELEELLTSQGGEPPSRIHGLAAITTTKKFGGVTGNTLSNIHTKEDRASLEHFTHHDRRVEHLENRTYETRSQESGVSEDTGREQISGHTRRIESKKDDHHTDRNDRSKKREEKVTEVKRAKLEERREKVEKREDKKTVRQSSVKSLTEKYIKSANDSGKADRSTYPKAGLILRTTTMRDSVSSDDAHPGLTRTDSEHSLGSVDDTVVTTERSSDGMRTTTTHTTHHHGPTVTTHTRGSTVITHHEPVITTKKTSTVITQEPTITRRVITQEPVITHRVISHEPVVKVTQGRQGSTVTTERSFLDSNTKVTGVQDILTRMKNADIVIQEGDSSEDREARALLNKFLGASVLMAGMQGYVADDARLHGTQETVLSSSSGGKVTSRTVEELDLDQCWDERLLKQLLDECTDYEQRRRLRARIRTLMAEQEACASAVTEALGAAGASDVDGGDGSSAREEEEVTVTSSVRRDSSDKTVSSSTTTKTSKVIEMTRPAPKPVSPFAKFRQLEKQNSINSPNSPKTPQSPGSPAQPYFKFTDPALQASALTIKERLLQWCRDKTRDYENVKLENFSTSWADGLAFCALVHHFLPDAFDYSKLTADTRRHNFTLAFKVADEKAGIYPLLDVDDMVAMRKPDWKCVFTYVQAIYRRFKDE